MKTDCNAAVLDFGRVGRRKLVADFEGGQLSSDGGSLLLRLVDERLRLSERFAARCIKDHRDPARVKHTKRELVMQRASGFALGYEDLNDHDTLRHDPLLAAAIGKADAGSKLASHATLNRLEHTPENPKDERYHRFDLDPELADDFFVDLAVARLKQEHGKNAPKQLVVDLDPSDVALHGEQEGRFFHGYYGHYCYLPLYAFCGEHLLAARLQTSDGDGSRNTIDVMQRIVAKFRAAWPQAQIVLRADSGFSREEIYAWCEANRVDYVIGVARNARLETLVQNELAQAKKAYEQSGEPARVFTEFAYETLDSWSRKRRVVAKAEYLGKSNPRFVVTSLSPKDLPARPLYEDLYCGRGEAENRIKEQQLYLFGDRLSAATMRANQNRMYFAALAYVLVHALRRLGLQQTELKVARADTIRLKLFKIAATIRVSVRRVWVRLASSCPNARTFRRARENLLAAPVLVM